MTTKNTWQQINEPQRAERLDEGFDGTDIPAWPQPASAAKAGALKPNWIVTHQHIESGEMNDLAVQVSAPVAVDH